MGGRAQQQAFWQRLLIGDAFNALSRSHLQIDVSDDRGSTCFFVTNLSERNPIRVCGGFEDVDCASPLALNEQRPVAHGDVIVVNPNRGNTLWLVFRDLMVGHDLGAAQASPAGPLLMNAKVLPLPPGVSRSPDDGADVAAGRAVDFHIPNTT